MSSACQQWIEDLDLVRETGLESEDPDILTTEEWVGRLQDFRRAVREAVGLHWEAPDQQILAILQRRPTNTC